MVAAVEHGQFEHQGDLPNLACVSRTFSEIALDILWHDVTSFAHIVSLLPQDAYSSSVPDQTDRIEIVSTFIGLIGLAGLG